MVGEWRTNAAMYVRLNKSYHEDMRDAERSWRKRSKDFRHAPCPKDVIPEEYTLQTVYLHVARKRGQVEADDSHVWCSYELMEQVQCPCCPVHHVRRSKVLVADKDSCREVFDKPRRGYMFPPRGKKEPRREAHDTIFIRKVKSPPSRPCPGPYVTLVSNPHGGLV